MNRFEKAAINVTVPYRSRKVPLFLPEKSRESYMTPSEAKAIASAMASAAPYGSLDYTQVDLNGAKLVDLAERAHNNPRNTEALKFLAAADIPIPFKNRYLADKTQLTGDAYYPASDKVVLPSGNPGALVRELGHAIDVNSFANSPSKRLFSNIYSNIAPDIWRDGAAWQKGRKALLEGGAAHNLNPKLVTKALEDAARIKPYSTGSNLGTAIGGLGGLGAGLYLNHLAHKNEWPLNVPTYMFPVAGGVGGALLGRVLGYIYGNKDYHSSDEARKKYMEEYVSAYARVNKMPKSQAREALARLASPKGVVKSAEFGAMMGKQAFLMFGGGQIGLHPPKKDVGVGVEAGYRNLLGVLPLPYAGIDVGGPNHGFKAGLTPFPYIGGRISHPRRSGITRNFPRGLVEVLYDHARGRSREDALKLSYPDYEESHEDTKGKSEDSQPKENKPKEKSKPKSKEASFKPSNRAMVKNSNKALVGGLGGALAGGLGSLAYDLIAQNKKNRFKRFLASLGAGGLAGAGIGHLYDRADGFLQDAAAASAKPKPLVGPPAPSTSGSFVGPPVALKGDASAAPAAAASAPAAELVNEVTAPPTASARRGLFGRRRG